MILLEVFWPSPFVVTLWCALNKAFQFENGLINFWDWHIVYKSYFPLYTDGIRIRALIYPNPQSQIFGE